VAERGAAEWRWVEVEGQARERAINFHESQILHPLTEIEEMSSVVCHEGISTAINKVIITV